MKIIFIDQQGVRRPVKEVLIGDPGLALVDTNTTGNVLAITCVDGTQFEGSEIWPAGCDLVIKP